MRSEVNQSAVWEVRGQSGQCEVRGQSGHCKFWITEVTLGSGHSGLGRISPSLKTKSGQCEVTGQSGDY